MSSAGFEKFWLAITSEEGAKERAGGVLKAISKYNPKSKKVLELGVGIGTVLRYFSKRYDVYGIDLLPKCIKICKKRLPKGRFYVYSMHKFSINEKFDVIFCVFDSVNFLKNFNQWKSTFKCVNNHLTSKGLFVFDMYTEKALKDFKKSTPQIKEFLMGYTYDKPIIKENEKNKILIWDFKVFERLKNGLFNLHKYKWEEKIYQVNVVRNTLKENFSILESYYFDKKRRIIFICRKKLNINQ